MQDLHATDDSELEDISNGQHDNTELINQHTDVAVPEHYSNLTKKSIEGARKLAAARAEGKSNEEMIPRIRLTLTWFFIPPTNQNTWTTTIQPQSLKPIHDAYDKALDTSGEGDRWSVFWKMAETLDVDRIAATELFQAFSTERKILPLQRLKELFKTRARLWQCMSDWFYLAKPEWESLDLSVTFLDEGILISDLPKGRAATVILGWCLDADEMLQFVARNEDVEVDAVPIDPALNNSEVRHIYEPPSLCNSENRDGPYQAAQGSGVEHQRASLLSKSPLFEPVRPREPILDPPGRDIIADNLSLNKTGSDSAADTITWDDAPGVKANALPTAEFISVDEGTRRAKVQWNKPVIKTKGSKREYPGDTDIALSLDPDGNPQDDISRRKTKVLPKEVDDIVDFLYNQCPRFRGLPKKMALFDQFEQHFTRRGDVAADSILHSFSPEEMGMHVLMWRYINNYSKTNSEVAAKVEYSRSNGLARAYRPRAREQDRAKADDVQRGKMSKRGLFSGNIPMKKGTPENTTDMLGMNSMDRAMGMLYVLVNEDIKAEDLGLKRIGTKFNTFHAALVQIFARSLELERWANELRMDRANLEGWYKGQARAALETAQEAVKRDNMWREICEENNITIPPALIDTLEVNKTLPRYWMNNSDA